MTNDGKVSKRVPDDSVVPARMSVAVTTMLTLMAYRFALGRLVPNLPYLTRFDYFTLGPTILIFLVLLLVAATTYLFVKTAK
jgi:glycine receptor alpha-4